MDSKTIRILITGTPGIGKTSLAKELGAILKCPVLNERQFAYENKIGEWNTGLNELEIGPKELEKALNREIRKHKRIVVEGHLLCEMKLKVDYAIVLRVHPEILEMRLEARGYNPEKVQDNVFCEGIDYCKKHMRRNCKKSKIIEIVSQRNIKKTKELTIIELRKRGAVI